MGTFSIWHWLIVGVVVLLLFGGGGKIPKLMRDMGQGINSFKKGLRETKDDAADGDGDDQKAIDGEAARTAAAKTDVKEETAAKG